MYPANRTLKDDIFEWHCTLRGPAGTEFDGGLYHFRILLPAEYPFRPPSIMILTPNGRFELNTKICISFTSYHEELWQPAWGVRTAILGLQGFFPLKGQAAVGVGSIEYPASERKRLAALSREWTCPHCKQSNLELLPDPPASTSASSDQPVAEDADVAPTTVAAAEIVPPAEIEPAPKGSAAPLPEQADGSKEADQSTMTEPRLTVAEENDMRAMAQALHDKLNKLQSREAVREAETLRNLSSRPQQAHVVRNEPAASESPRVASSVSTPATPSGPTATRTMQRSAHKPPLLLDTAICILLVLLFAIICRRMV
uniref:UBC core domain-containing protein n=1 Tax=Psilocybe cubensis TaxID=181762 RepID=A0A8H7Y4T3_PSICU